PAVPSRWTGSSRRFGSGRASPGARRRRSTSAKKGTYHYGDKAHAFGPVVSATLAAKRITLGAKGAAITYPLLGTGPHQELVLAIVFPAGTANPSDAICADFPGARGGLKTDDPKKGVFTAAKAEAPGTRRALR